MYKTLEIHFLSSLPRRELLVPQIHYAWSYHHDFTCRHYPLFWNTFLSVANHPAYPTCFSSKSLKSSLNICSFMDPFALLYNHWFMCVFCTKLQVCSGHGLYPLWFYTPYTCVRAHIHTHTSVPSLSNFTLYSQKQKVLSRPPKNSRGGEELGTTDIWTFWTAPEDWHSGETKKVRLTTLMNQIYQMRKNTPHGIA